MQLLIPRGALVVLIGASGSGKSTFARRHFSSTQIVSSDYYRGIVCDDTYSLAASHDAFDLVHRITRMRLARRCLTVVDSTAVEDFARQELRSIAASYDAPSVAIIFDIPLEVCIARDATRPRPVGESVIRMQKEHLHRGQATLADEGWSEILTLTPDLQDVLQLAAAI